MLLLLSLTLLSWVVIVTVIMPIVDPFVDDQQSRLSASVSGGESKATQRTKNLNENGKNDNMERKKWQEEKEEIIVPISPRKRGDFVEIKEASRNSQVRASLLSVNENNINNNNNDDIENNKKTQQNKQNNDINTNDKQEQSSLKQNSPLNNENINNNIDNDNNNNNIELNQNGNPLKRIFNEFKIKCPEKYPTKVPKLEQLTKICSNLKDFKIYGGCDVTNCSKCIPPGAKAMPWVDKDVMFLYPLF